MDRDRLLERIALNRDVMVGKPVICGTRLTVEYILGLLAAGASFQEVLDEYPGLVEDDLRACLLFATEALARTSFVPLTAKAS